MLDTPQFIQTDEPLTAVIHLIVSSAEISNVMEPANHSYRSREMSKLPAAQVVRATYRAEYEGLGQLGASFARGIGRAQAQDSLWECYLSGPESR